MLSLDRAVDRCIDSIIIKETNLYGVDIYAYMYRYKAIRSLPDDQFEAVYDRIEKCIFGTESR